MMNYLRTETYEQSNKSIKTTDTDNQQT